MRKGNKSGWPTLVTIPDRMIAGGGDLMQKGARRLRPVEDSQEG